MKAILKKTRKAVEVDKFDFTYYLDKKTKEEYQPDELIFDFSAEGIMIFTTHHPRELQIYLGEDLTIQKMGQCYEMRAKEDAFHGSISIPPRLNINLEPSQSTPILFSIKAGCPSAKIKETGETIKTIKRGFTLYIDKQTNEEYKGTDLIEIYPEEEIRGQWWLARNIGGRLGLFYEKPIKDLFCDDWYVNEASHCMDLPRDFYKDITWESSPKPAIITIRQYEI